MQSAWATGYALGAWGSPFGAAGSPSQNACERRSRRLAKLEQRYAQQGGRRFIGIKVGSGEKRLSKLRRKTDSACAQAEAQDPNAAFEAAFLAAQGAMPAAPVDLTSTDTGMDSLTIAAIVGVILLGIGGLFVMGRG